MKRLGIWLIVLGGGSFLLHMINMEFILVSWVDMWGETTGYIIRGVMVLLGIILLALNRND